MKLFCILIICALSCDGAVVFDGIDDMIGFGTCGDAILKENAAQSISAWINPITDGEATTGNIVRRGSVQFRMGSPQQLQFRVAGATALVRASVGAAVATNFWSHVVMTWDGSLTAANIHLYVNGVEVSYSTTTNGATLTDDSTDPVLIGNNTGGTVSFNGSISNVAVWSSVLNATDIANLFRGKVYQMPLMVSPTTLLAYWPLDDFADGVTLSGTDTIKDRSPNAHHGSQTNSPVARAATIISYP